MYNKLYLKVKSYFGTYPSQIKLTRFNAVLFWISENLAKASLFQFRVS